MTRVRGRHALLLLALCASFSAGILVDGWLRTRGLPQPVEAAATPSHTMAAPIVAAALRPADLVAGPADLVAGPAGLVAGPAGQSTILAAPVPTFEAQPLSPLRMPIDGTSLESFKGGFSETRGSHVHEAVDIVVPRGTPIHAVQDGTIAKLFFSRFGGTTIYQFDPDGRLCYYYAHLDRYADGLHDGQHVSQGEVIGYVGSSGNAAPGTPHLHFGIFELNADRKWWQGRPLDPYLVFKEKGLRVAREMDR